jgi:hypothetical protein
MEGHGAWREFEKASRSFARERKLESQCPRQARDSLAQGLQCNTRCTALYAAGFALPNDPLFSGSLRLLLKIAPSEDLHGHLIFDFLVDLHSFLFHPFRPLFCAQLGHRTGTNFFLRPVSTYLKYYPPFHSLLTVFSPFFDPYAVLVSLMSLHHARSDPNEKGY